MAQTTDDVSRKLLSLVDQIPNEFAPPPAPNLIDLATAEDPGQLARIQAAVRNSIYGNPNPIPTIIPGAVKITDSKELETANAAINAPRTTGNAGVDRVNVAAAEGRFGSNIVKATTDAEGRVTITGTGKLAGVPTGNINQRIGAPTASPAEGLASQMAAIQAMDNSAPEKIGAIYNLHGSLQAELAKFEQGAMNQAELQFQVPALRTALAENEKLDRADKEGWAKHGSDSVDTRRVREQLIQAESAARITSGKIFEMNPEVAKLKGLVTPFIAAQENMYKTQENKQAGINMVASQKVASLGSGALDLARITEKDPKADFSAIALKNIDHKDFYNAATAIDTPETLVPMALSGNAFARKALIYKQAESSGASVEKDPVQWDAATRKANDDVVEMTKLIHDPAYFKQRFTEAYPSRAQAELLAQSSLGTGKEADAQRAAFRISEATKFIALKNKNDFLGNVNTWGVPTFSDPATPLGKAYEIARRERGTEKLPVEAIVASINALPTDEAIAAKDQLTKTMNLALQKSSGAYFGQFAGAINVDTIVNTNLAMEKLKKFLGTVGTSTGVGVAAGAAYGAIPTLGLGAPAGAAVGGIYGLVGGGIKGTMDYLNTPKEGKQ